MPGTPAAVRLQVAGKSATLCTYEPVVYGMFMFVFLVDTRLALSG